MERAIGMIGSRVQPVLNLHPCYLADVTQEAPHWHAFITALASVFPTVVVWPGVWLHTNQTRLLASCRAFEIYRGGDVIVESTE